MNAGDVPPPPFLLGDDKRTLILRAAHTLFLRDGYSVTSMDAITKQAGVSKATVYAHFDSKEKLFETLVRVGSQSVLAMTPSLLRRGGDPQEEVINFFIPFLTILIEHGGYNWSRMVIAEAGRHPENAKFFYECTLGHITKNVEDYLGVLVREKLFETSDLRESAELIISIVLIGPLQRTLLLGPEGYDYQKVIRGGVNLLFKKAK